MRNTYWDNCLSLDEWARIIGVNPYHLHQLTDINDLHENYPSLPTERSECEEVFFEYIWQNFAISRDEINRAIHAAEELFRDETGFYPCPKEITETFPFQPKCNDRYYTDCCKPKKIRLQNKYLESFGVYVWEKVIDEVTATVTPVGDFTITFPVADLPVGMTIDEIVLVYNENVRPIDVDFREWMVNPVYIRLINSDTEVQIIGKSYLIVKANEYLDPSPSALDIQESTFYETSFEIWRKSFDATQQGNFLYNNRCSQDSQTICSEVVNYKLSIIEAKPAYYDVDNDRWVVGNCNSCTNRKFPDFLRVNYVAGYPLKNGKIDPKIAQIIAWLATSLLVCDKCTCNCNPINYYRGTYTAKLEYVEGKREAVMLTAKMMEDTKWGFRTGAVMAWNAIRQLRIFDAYIMG